MFNRPALSLGLSVRSMHAICPPVQMMRVLVRGGKHLLGVFCAAGGGVGCVRSPCHDGGACLSSYLETHLNQSWPTTIPTSQAQTHPPILHHVRRRGSSSHQQSPHDARTPFPCTRRNTPHPSCRVGLCCVRILPARFCTMTSRDQKRSSPSPLPPAQQRARRQACACDRVCRVRRVCRVYVHSVGGGCHVLFGGGRAVYGPLPTP